MIEYIHLSGHIYSMHRTSFQQSLESLPCIVENLLFSLLEKDYFSSSLKVRAGGKNLLIYASTNSSQVFIDPTGNESNHVAATSLSEKGEEL